MDDMAHWSIGNAERISVWTDYWVRPDVKVDLQSYGSVGETQNQRVFDLVNARGEWDLSRIKDLLPVNFQNDILTLNPPHPENGKDVCNSKGNKSGMFSMASAYQYDQYASEIWNLIWKIAVPERVRSLIWMAKHESLITNEWLSKRGLGQPYCDDCTDKNETVMHVLQDCNIARQAWTNLSYTHNIYLFFSCATCRFGSISI